MTRACLKSPTLLFVLGCLAATACIDFSGYHVRQNADALVPVLCSLYHWEPFYWGQDRLGMLLPAMARPVRDPFANLLVQNGIGILACLLSIGLLAWYLLRSPVWRLAAGGGVIIFLLAFPARERFHLLNGSQPYPLAVLLAVGAVFLAAGRTYILGRVVAALTLTALAYWYNSGIGVVIAPLAFLRFASTLRTAGARREFVAAVLLTAFGTAFGRLLMMFADQHKSSLSFAPSETWLAAWETLATKTFTRFDVCFIILGVLAALGIPWLLVRTTRPAALHAWRMLLIIVAWLTVLLLAFGTMEWVQRNDLDIRYLFIGILALAPACAAVALAPALELCPQWRGLITRFTLLLMPMAAVLTYGVPSITAARGALDQSTGMWTADLRAGRCTHIVGEYWDVWQAMFHLNMAAPQPEPVWGIAFRAECSRDRWWNPDPATVRLGLLNRPVNEPYFPASEFHWRASYPRTRVVETRPTLTVLVPIAMTESP